MVTCSLLEIIHLFSKKVSFSLSLKRFDFALTWIVSFVMMFYHEVGAETSMKL